MIIDYNSTLGAPFYHFATSVVGDIGTALFLLLLLVLVFFIALRVPLQIALIFTIPLMIGALLISPSGVVLAFFGAVIFILATALVTQFFIQ